MMSGQPLSPEAFAQRLHVSRETLKRLTVYLELLRRWQRAINLVGPATLVDPWRRHFLDCGQLAARIPAGAASLVDLGSGAGFPGMVLAILGVREIDLIESDRRKAQFLREVARATGTSVRVHAERIERLCGVAGRCHHHTRACAFAAPARARRAVPGVRQRLPFLEGTVRRA